MKNAPLLWPAWGDRLSHNMPACGRFCNRIYFSSASLYYLVKCECTVFVKGIIGRPTLRSVSGMGGESLVAKVSVLL